MAFKVVGGTGGILGGRGTLGGLGLSVGSNAGGHPTIRARDAQRQGGAGGNGGGFGAGNMDGLATTMPDFGSGFGGFGGGGAPAAPTPAMPPLTAPMMGLQAAADQDPGAGFAASGSARGGNPFLGTRTPPAATRILSQLAKVY